MEDVVDCCDVVRRVLADVGRYRDEMQRDDKMHEEMEKPHA